MPEADISRVTDDKQDYYGQEYWFSHQEQDFGFANIQGRSRTDLPERCLYWLRTLLKYRLPPSRILELGSAHGGFVAMLNWTGFEAMGLELSPWVVRFAQDTFQIPMVNGPIEDQDFDEESFDAIVLMDVLEHLPDPLGTMRRCLQLLKGDGFLLIQTPGYPDDKTYQELIETNDRFVEMLIPNEHLYLFSRNSIQSMFKQLGWYQFYFEPSLFEYDMFLVVSRVPLQKNNPDEVIETLLHTPSGRLVLALLDLYREKNTLESRWSESEADRAARLEIIHQLSSQLEASEADRAARLEVIHQLSRQLEASEADRAARLEVIRSQEQMLKTQEQMLDRLPVKVLRRMRLI